LLIALFACHLPTQNPKATSLNFPLTVLDKGTYSGFTEKELSFMVIKEKQEFLKVFSMLHSIEILSPPPPPVDFKEKIVIVLLFGQKPTGGFSIDFGRTYLSPEGALSIEVKLKEPSPSSILTQALTSPYAIAKIQKKGIKVIRFIDEKNNILKELPLLNS